MKTIKVLGTGCATCKQLESLVRQIVEETGMEASVEKVEDMQEIISWKVLSTPGLVVDDKVKCSGRIPSRDEIREMLA